MFWDVNLWVYAFRSDSPLHEKTVALLDKMVDEKRPFLYSESVIASFLRLVTNNKIFRNPSPIDEAWGFVDWVRQHEFSKMLAYDEMALGIFKHMSIVYKAQGNNIPDLALASLCVRYDCELVTADKAFDGIDGLTIKLLS